MGKVVQSGIKGRELRVWGWGLRVKGSGCRGPGLSRPGSRRARAPVFRGGLVFETPRLCVSLNSRLENNKEEKKRPGTERKKQISMTGTEQVGN